MPYPSSLSLQDLCDVLMLYALSDLGIKNIAAVYHISDKYVCKLAKHYHLPMRGR